MNEVSAWIWADEANVIDLDECALCGAQSECSHSSGGEE